MIVKVSTNYKGVSIEVSENIDPNDSKSRKALVQQLEWTRQNVDDVIHPEEFVYSNGKVDKIEPEDVEEDSEQEYLLITENQKNYLRKLGLSEAKIAKIKTKAQATAKISELQKGK